MADLPAGAYRSGSVDYSTILDTDDLPIGYSVRGKDVYFPRTVTDSSGNTVGIADPVGGGVNIAVNSAYVFQSGDTSGVTDTANIKAAIARVEASIAARGNLGAVVVMGGDFYINDTLVLKNGIIQDFPTPNTTNTTIGARFVGLGKGLTRINMLTAAKQAILFYSPTAVSHLISTYAGGFSLFGPGGGGAETVGMQIGGINVNASEDLNFEDINIENFTATIRTENVCNITFRRVSCGNYTRGCEFGYNSDTIVFENCRFGDENAVTNAGTALSYTYRSALHPSGGLATNAHTFIGCWFMRQILVADIYEESTSSIKFDTCYYERSTQYAKLGRSGVATGPHAITWDNCHFSQPYDATETLAKIEVQHANSTAQLTIRNCRSDDATGPQIAYVKIGYDTRLEWNNNDLPAVGGQIVNETGRYFTYAKSENAIIGRGLRVLADHTLNSGLPVVLTEVHNPSYSSGSESNLASFRNVVKSTGATNSSGNIITLAIDTVAWSGLVRSRRTSPLPTATSQWEGVVVALQGGSGVVSQLFVCLKSAADTYSWKVVATG